MTIAERLHAQGRRVFESRSVVPLVLIPCVGLAMPESWNMEVMLGDTGSVAVQWLALLVAAAGLTLRCAAVAFAPVGTSSRDTRAMRAPVLNTTGAYSVVRHPLYLGAGLMWLGVAMSLRVWWLVVIAGLIYWLYIERVAIAEEAFLLERFPEQFQGWVARTPAFIPRWSGWQRSAYPLQAKRLLTEHNGLLAVALSFVVLQFLEDQQHGGEPWSVFAAEHADLIGLAQLAIGVSLLCIVIRRWPSLTDDAGSCPNRSAVRGGRSR